MQVSEADKKRWQGYARQKVADILKDLAFSERLRKMDGSKKGKKLKIRLRRVGA